ncbi:TPA: DNA methyltransferase [Salmonella enterica subsp. enterica serovar Bahrenfeld]
MSRFILGNCVDIMSGFPERAVDFILTDPPYLVGFRDRSGRSIAGDKTDEWLQPACNEMYRVLKKDALMVSFYGWNRVDRFMAAWKSAGFSVVGHLVFTKTYSSKSAYVGYRHECAYLLAKGRPALPPDPLPDVLGWKYSGNRHHPTADDTQAVLRAIGESDSDALWRDGIGQNFVEGVLRELAAQRPPRQIAIPENELRILLPLINLGLCHYNDITGEAEAALNTLRHVLAANATNA